MNRRFVRSLQAVTAVHVGLLLLLLVLPSLHLSLFRSKPDVMQPAEFCVDVSNMRIERAEKTEVPRFLGEEKPKKTEESVISRKKENKPKPTIKKPSGQQREGGGQIKMPNPPLGRNRRNPMTPEEVQKWLEMGAKPSDHTSIPADEEVRCLEVIRSVFYDAWIQPSKDEAGDSVVEVTLRFGQDGAIAGASMTKKSGKPVLDDSVMLAVNSVKEVRGLTPGFLKKHETVPVEFYVKEE